MKQKTTNTGTSASIILLLVVIVISGVLLVKDSMKPKMQPGDFTSVSDLDTASAQLDRTDIDGLGNELPQLNSDASTF